MRLDREPPTRGDLLVEAFAWLAVTWLAIAFVVRVVAELR